MASPTTSPSRTPTPTPPAAPTTAPQHDNPKVGELHAMFPNVELSVIELVLETCNGSTDRAIEQLLGMTDPNFKPDELAGANNNHQVDLDAEFARSLQVQDEQNYRRSQQQYEASLGPAATSAPGQLPYQPRVRRARPPQPQGAYQPESETNRFAEYEAKPDGDNPPGALMMEEKIERFAEAGKQTFNSFLSRAKAKYSEFQAAQAQRQPNAQSQTSYYNQGPSYSGGNVNTVGGGRGGDQNRSSGGGGLWGDVRSHSPSISGRSESISSQSTLDMPQVQQKATQVPVRQQSKRWQPSDAFDDPVPLRQTPSPKGDPHRPMSASPDKQGRIDPAKLGILPKKRVDLMSTSPSNSSHLKEEAAASGSGSGTGTGSGQKAGGEGVEDDEDRDPNPSLPNASLVSKIPPTPPATSPYRLEDSDDELEYTKNPFDER